MAVYQSLLLLNPLLFLSLGMVAGMFAAWKSKIVMMPVMSLVLSLFIMIVLQHLSYDPFLLVYAAIYAFISLIGLGIVRFLGVAFNR